MINELCPQNITITVCTVCHTQLPHTHTSNTYVCSTILGVERTVVMCAPCDMEHSRHEARARLLCVRICSNPHRRAHSPNYTAATRSLARSDSGSIPIMRCRAPVVTFLRSRHACTNRKSKHFPQSSLPSTNQPTNHHVYAIYYVVCVCVFSMMMSPLVTTCAASTTTMAAMLSVDTDMYDTRVQRQTYLNRCSYANRCKRQPRLPTGLNCAHYTNTLII